jgi:hypothetical protein
MDKYKSAREQMTQILLLKQVDGMHPNSFLHFFNIVGKFQLELSVINCNESYEIKKLRAEFEVLELIYEAVL